MSLCDEFKLVKISEKEFCEHHDECLAIADELFKLSESLASLSLPFSTKLNELANRLDKSIYKLPAKFD